MPGQCFWDRARADIVLDTVPLLTKTWKAVTLKTSKFMQYRSISDRLHGLQQRPTGVLITLHGILQKGMVHCNFLWPFI